MRHRDDQKETKSIKSSWRSFPAQQQPIQVIVCKEILKGFICRITFAGESQSLKQNLAEVLGEALCCKLRTVLKISRCHGPSIHDLLKVILQMSIIHTYAGERRL